MARRQEKWRPVGKTDPKNQEEVNRQGEERRPELVGREAKKPERTRAQERAWTAGDG